MDLPKMRGAERPHLSQSRAFAYLGCGWQYFLVNERTGGRRRGAPKRARLAFGSAAHRTAAGYLEGEKSWSRDRVRDEYRTALANEMADVELDRKEKEEFVNRARAQDKLKVQGDALLGLFVEQSAPLIEPVAVEIEVRIPTSAHFDIVVIPDIIEPDAIGDLKFSVSALDADDSLQLTVEALAFAYRNDGRFPAEVYYERFRRGERGGTRERIPSTRSRDDAATAAQVFETVAHGIENDVFLPTGLGTWRCSYCAFGVVTGDGSCKFVARGVRPEVQSTQ